MQMNKSGYHCGHRQLWFFFLIKRLIRSLFRCWRSCQLIRVMFFLVGFLLSLQSWLTLNSSGHPTPQIRTWKLNWRIDFPVNIYMLQFDELSYSPANWQRNQQAWMHHSDFLFPTCLGSEMVQTILLFLGRHSPSDLGHGSRRGHVRHLQGWWWPGEKTELL